MLFFYVQQDSKNAHGTMPFGSCPQDATPVLMRMSWTPISHVRRKAASVYSVIVDPQKYTPAPNETPLTPAQIAKYEQAPPQNQNRLAYVNADGTIGDIVESDAKDVQQELFALDPEEGRVLPTDGTGEEALEAGGQGSVQLDRGGASGCKQRHGSAGLPPNRRKRRRRRSWRWRTWLCRCAARRNEAAKASSLG